MGGASRASREALPATSIGGPSKLDGSQCGPSGYARGPNNERGIHLRHVTPLLGPGTRGTAIGASAGGSAGRGFSLRIGCHRDDAPRASKIPRISTSAARRQPRFVDACEGPQTTAIHPESIVTAKSTDGLDITPARKGRHQ